MAGGVGTCRGESLGDAVPDPLPGDVGVEVLGGVPADRALHLDHLDPGAERRGLGADVLVAGDHRDRDAVVLATSALIPASPVTVPLRVTSAIARGL